MDNQLDNEFENKKIDYDDLLYIKNQYLFNHADYESDTKDLSLEIAKIVGKNNPEGKREQLLFTPEKILRAWEEAAGKDVLKITRQVFVRKDEVIISVATSVWAQELAYFSDEYIERLNKYLGTSQIKKMRFVTKGYR